MNEVFLFIHDRQNGHTADHLLNPLNTKCMNINERKFIEEQKKKRSIFYVDRRLVNIAFRIMKDKIDYVQPEVRTSEEMQVKMDH